MKGANTAFNIPMNMKRRFNLNVSKLRWIRKDRRAYPSMSTGRFLDLRNTFLTLPCWSKRYSMRQNRRFHSSARVNIVPFPSSSTMNRLRMFGSGTRKSSRSLLNKAIR